MCDGRRESGCRSDALSPFASRSGARRGGWELMVYWCLAGVSLCALETGRAEALWQCCCVRQVDIRVKSCSAELWVGMDTAALQQDYSSNLYSPHYQVGCAVHCIQTELPAGRTTSGDLCFLLLHFVTGLCCNQFIWKFVSRCSRWVVCCMWCCVFSKLTADDTLNTVNKHSADGSQRGGWHFFAVNFVLFSLNPDDCVQAAAVSEKAVIFKISSTAQGRSEVTATELFCVW